MDPDYIPTYIPPMPDQQQIDTWLLTEQAAGFMQQLFEFQQTPVTDTQIADAAQVGIWKPSYPSQVITNYMQAHIAIAENIADGWLDRL